jgi:ABC-type uncharacterized transport system substrate-binding protein
MKRREFIAIVGAAATWPLGARAEYRRPIIGFLSPTSAGSYDHILAGFRNGLRETGYVEGQNVEIEYRWANDDYGRLSELATELVSKSVSIIVTASGTPTALAAKAATSTIPILFVIGTDPVSVGLVESFNRPGRNLTGISLLTTVMAEKRFELLCELVPSASVVGLIVNPANPVTQAIVSGMQAAAKAVHRTILVLNVSSEADFDVAFEVAKQNGVTALVTSDDPILINHRVKLAELALRYSIPAVYSNRDAVLAGGLMAYGTNYADTFRQIGVYAGRILKGESPSNLPVMQPAKFDFIINKKVVATMGLTIPAQLTIRADEVIE